MGKEPHDSDKRIHKQEKRLMILMFVVAVIMLISFARKFFS
ncbi:hypothetical protein [Paenibacillus gansuensis]|uniref:DUF4044 domain-containing protein n=1 Tax=Paenibacillus gansuensis TaxID=306542 RepID=A0ABW5PFF3_9BACL